MENKKEENFLDLTKPLMAENQIFYPANDFQLSKKDHQQFLQEINATGEMEATCLKLLKERLKDEKGIRYRTDDDFLLRYLRFRKLDCEKTRTGLRNLYAARKKFPEIFTLPANIEFLLNTRFITYLPYKDEEGRVILWVNYRNWKLEDMTFINMMQVCSVVNDTIGLNPSCQTNGIIYIWDFKDITMYHMKECISPRYLRLSVNSIQDVYPFRLKRIIVLNANVIFRIAWNLARPFMKKKIADRLTVLGSDISELHKYVNPVILPKVYGGNLEESDCSVTRQVMGNLLTLEYDRSFGLISEK